MVTTRNLHLCLTYGHNDLMLKTALVFISFFWLAVTTASASGFVLTHIGNLDTGGRQYPEWWYQGNNPTLAGTAAPSAAVDVTVDSSSQSVTADASGNWSAATAITTGDHSLSLVSGGSTIAFTLHLNQTMPANVGTPSAATQPVAGSLTPTLVIFLSGLTAATLGLLYKHRLAHH